MTPTVLGRLKRSLPPRERELKLELLAVRPLCSVSLPPRERELKPLFLFFLFAPTRSLPPRERELKPCVGGGHRAR